MNRTREVLLGMYSDIQSIDRTLHVYKTMGESDYKVKSDIASVYIHSEVAYINMMQFRGWRNLKNVYIENGPKAIYQYAFLGCESLTHISIPPSIQFIDMGAFCQCTNLTKLDLGDGVIELGDHICTRCDRLKEIRIPASAILIDEDALHYTKIKRVIGAQGSCAQYYAQKHGFDFIAASRLDTAGICGDGVYWSYSRENHELRISGSGRMWDYGWKHRAPWRVFRVESVVIEDNVKSIGTGAFLNCIFLKNVEIGKNVSQIANNAFQCSGIPKRIVIHPNNDYLHLENRKIIQGQNTISFSNFDSFSIA